MERIDLAEIDTQRPRNNPAKVERELDDLLKQQGILERKLPSPEPRISLEHFKEAKRRRNNTRSDATKANGNAQCQRRESFKPSPRNEKRRLKLLSKVKLNTTPWNSNAKRLLFPHPT